MLKLFRLDMRVTIYCKLNGGHEKPLLFLFTILGTYWTTISVLLCHFMHASIWIDFQIGCNSLKERVKNSNCYINIVNDVKLVQVLLYVKVTLEPNLFVFFGWTKLNVELPKRTGIQDANQNQTYGELSKEKMDRCYIHSWCVLSNVRLFVSQLVPELDKLS